MYWLLFPVTLYVSHAPHDDKSQLFHNKILNAFICFSWASPGLRPVSEHIGPRLSLPVSAHVCVCSSVGALRRAKGPSGSCEGPNASHCSQPDSWDDATASAAVPLPPFFTSHTSPGKRCAYLPAPTALPQTDRVFLQVGRILPKKYLGPRFYICHCQSAWKSLRALDQGAAPQTLSRVTCFPLNPLCHAIMSGCLCELQLFIVLLVFPPPHPVPNLISHTFLQLSDLTSRSIHKGRAASL